MERLKNRPMSQDSQNVIAQTTSTKHPSLEQQRRRPSSIAEQAMRKLALGNPQRFIRKSLESKYSHFMYVLF